MFKTLSTKLSIAQIIYRVERKFHKPRRVAIKTAFTCFMNI
jgi:hypothetical protein